MKTTHLRFENKNEGHNKFYELEGPIPRTSQGEEFFVVDTWRGPIGKKGTWIVYPYPTLEAAKQGIKTISEERKKHGYQKVRLKPQKPKKAKRNQSDKPPHFTQLELI